MIHDDLTTAAGALNEVLKPDVHGKPSVNIGSRMLEKKPTKVDMIKYAALGSSEYNVRPKSVGNAMKRTFVRERAQHKLVEYREA